MTSIEVTNRDRKVDRIKLEGVVRECDGTFGREVSDIGGDASLKAEAKVTAPPGRAIVGFAFTVHRDEKDIYIGIAYREINSQNRLVGDVFYKESSNTPAGHEFERTCFYAKGDDDDQIYKNQRVLVGLGLTETGNDAEVITFEYIDLAEINS